jgi:hypothetical protein
MKARKVTRTVVTTTAHDLRDALTVTVTVDAPPDAAPRNAKANPPVRRKRSRRGGTNQGKAPP